MPGTSINTVAVLTLYLPSPIALSPFPAGEDKEYGRTSETTGKSGWHGRASLQTCACRYSPVLAHAS